MIVLEQLIMSSHEDLDVWATIRVGFDENKNFIVEFEHLYNDSPEFNYKKIAYIRPDEAFLLSKKLKLSLLQLPDCFKRLFGNSDNFSCPSDVKALFSEILQYITESRISYRFKGE